MKNKKIPHSEHFQNPIDNSIICEFVDILSFILLNFFLSFYAYITHSDLPFAEKCVLATLQWLYLTIVMSEILPAVYP